MLKVCLPPAERQSQNAPAPLRERHQAFAHDWALPPGAAWLSAQEIASALHVTRRHVFHLILDGSFDRVIDIRSPAAAQSYWRIWRRSFLRFGQRARGEACARFYFDAELAEALARHPSTLSGQQLAAHFRCSKQHIANLSPEFPNVGVSTAHRAFVRLSQGELMNFIKKRLV
ncbi:MAG TPA: hypothetical protein VHB20_17490 [Verrucomicrobiae bacterium]|jgi:hypothetical protein|nr:hypothetical protein [Verrucomicrobiae bacterium]